MLMALVMSSTEMRESVCNFMTCLLTLPADDESDNRIVGEHVGVQAEEVLAYQEVIEKNLGVMDLTCASLCKDGGMTMLVFNLNKKGSIEKAVKGAKIGTIIK